MGLAGEIVVVGNVRNVSKEYLRLYEAECLTAEELDDIRKKGLR